MQVLIVLDTGLPDLQRSEDPCHSIAWIQSKTRCIPCICHNMNLNIDHWSASGIFNNSENSIELRLHRLEESVCSLGVGDALLVTTNCCWIFKNSLFLSVPAHQ